MKMDLKGGVQSPNRSKFFWKTEPMAFRWNSEAPTVQSIYQQERSPRSILLWSQH